MNKKLVFVIQIDADIKYEYRIRAAILYIQNKIIKVFKGHMQLDEVKVQD